MQQLSTTVHQNQVKNDGAIADLKKHMSQLATAMSALTNEPGRLPSQTVQNPKGNVNVVALRSGKKLAVAPMEREEDESPELPEESKDAPEEEENAPEERRPGQARYQRPTQCPELRPLKSALLFHFQSQPEYQNSMSWMRTCLSYSVKSKSTSPSWRPSSKSLDMLSF
ncbi:unnamed protein product [Rhodiola kirilowii]